MRKKMELEERLFITQRDVLLQWIQEHGVTAREQLVIVTLGGITVFQYRNRWSKRRGIQHDAPCRFVLCEKGCFDQTKEQLGLQGEWRMIFDHPGYQVLESCSYYEYQGLPFPLRLGLTIEEKKWIVDEVRCMLKGIDGSKVPGPEEKKLSRWNQQQEMQLTFWMKTSEPMVVRVRAQSCYEALVAGAKRALQLAGGMGHSKKWFEETRIEVTLLSDLIFPLLPSDWRRNQIDTTKGYTFEMTRLQKGGYFLPEVHHRFTFITLRDFLSQIAAKESGIAFDQSTGVQYGHGAVIDWIENYEKNVILDVFGGVASQLSISNEQIQVVLQGASAWICEQQQENGSVPAKFDVTGMICEESNLALLGCTGHALAVYGVAFEDVEAIGAAERIERYLKSCLDQPELLARLRHSEVTFFDAYVEVYRLFMSLTLGRPIDQQTFSALVKQLPFFRRDCILWLEALSLLLEYEQVSGDQCYHDLVESEVIEVERLFGIRREYGRRSLSSLAELLVVYDRLFRLTGNEEWRNKALDLSGWYGSKQNKDGSFPRRLGNSAPYTRGTAKIAEGLACFPVENRVVLQGCLSWLASMQYAEENTYFLNEAAYRRLAGGFRHDALNKEAWIDASGHTILALTRYLKNQCG